MQFEQLNDKGDFIKFCEENSPAIKEIDTAVPMDIYNDLNKDIRHQYVTVYWVDGVISYMSVVDLAQEIHDIDEPSDDFCDYEMDNYAKRYDCEV